MTTQIDSATTFSSSSLPHQEVSLITINTTAQTPLKLISTNYLSWKLQFETLFIGYDLIRYIDGSTPCPPNPILVDNVTITNPSHKFWIRQDKLLLNALIGSLSPTIIPFIACAKTAQEAWNILANTYAKPSRGRIKQIKNQLKHPSKGSQSITEFLHSVKATADELAILGAPMDPEDLTDTILDGLDEDYKELVRAVQARDTSISFDELHEKLLSFEAMSSSHATPLPITANLTQKSSPTWRNTRSSFNFCPPSPSSANSQFWRSSPPSTFRPTFNRPNYRPARPPLRPYQGFCQICGIQGHTAKRCPSFQLVPTNATNTESSASQHSSSSWQPRVNFVANNSSPSPTWLLDSGASHHVTADLENLSLHSPYSGSDDVMIGDGTNLPITHTGSTHLSSPTSSFTLSNVLCVPTMQRNLISVYQFCVTNNVSVEFLPSLFFVKDLQTGAILFQGSVKDGVYEWPAFRPQSPPLLAFSTTKTTSAIWHSRLGHPAFPILKHVLTHSHLASSASITSDFYCNACLCNKSHKLPFSTSTLVSTNPLQIVFSDVWTSPIVSSAGFKYYVIFVDHFTKYVWFYPLKRKSDVHDVFTRYKAIVENYFKHRIVTLYTDNGGEFLSLRNFLSTAGITHMTTPPHTPELNGYSERRHRHIVETGLTLLSHASLPLTFWNHAFSAAVYLINRMPTTSLNLSSPFELIFKTTPNYSKLKSFGCLCYPWIRPYSSHKLDPKSKPCVFLGYSLSQHAYLCFEPSTSKTFVSRHVQFVESVFPYTHLHSTLPRPNSTTAVSWLPPVITVSVPLPSQLSSYTPVITAPELPPAAATSIPPLSAASPIPPSPLHTQPPHHLPVTP